MDCKSNPKKFARPVNFQSNPAISHYFANFTIGKLWKSGDLVQKLPLQSNFDWTTEQFGPLIRLSSWNFQPFLRRMVKNGNTYSILVYLRLSTLTDFLLRRAAGSALDWLFFREIWIKRWRCNCRFNLNRHKKFVFKISKIAAVTKRF